MVGERMEHYVACDCGITGYADKNPDVARGLWNTGWRTLKTK